MKHLTKRVLIFPFNLQAHYLRCLVLADQLYKEHGYEIIFAYSENYHQYVSQHGYASFKVKQLDAERAVRETAQFNFSWLEQAEIEQVMKAQITAIKNLQPQLVIGDAEPTLKMATEYCNVKYISLLNGYLSPYYDSQRQISKKHPAYTTLRWMPAIVAESLVRIGEKMVFRKIHQSFKTLRQKYKLQTLESYTEELEGDEVYICDNPRLFPQKDLPVNYKIIGPLTYLSEQNDMDWLNTLDLQKPIICVCMGSSGDWEKLRFLNDPYYAKYSIIAAGDKKRILTASHIIRKDFVNLAHVLQFAHLMICHGGNGTINCGYDSGVFMLCLPSHVEQEWNVHALEKCGAGLLTDHFSEEDWQIEIDYRIKKRLEVAVEVVLS